MQPYKFDSDHSDDDHGEGIELEGAQDSRFRLT